MLTADRACSVSYTLFVSQGSVKNSTTSVGWDDRKEKGQSDPIALDGDTTMWTSISESESEIEVGHAISGIAATTAAAKTTEAASESERLPEVWR